MKAESWAAGLGLLGVLAVGFAAGTGGFTFFYAKGYSYLSDDPAACANCHIMREQYQGWTKSSHHAVATCNSCHTPRDFFGKYASKASNGFWHSFAFTSGRFPDPIRIKPHNLEIAEENCRNCHQGTVQAMLGPQQQASTFSCVRCHESVGHMR